MLRSVPCIFALSLMVMSGSCGSKADTCNCEKYGLAFNIERQKLGLTVLKADWKLTCETNECTWKSALRSGYTEKRLKLDQKGLPLSEKDIYHITHLGRKNTPKAWFEYDYANKQQTSYTLGKLADEPYYDVRSSIVERQIDYLHYYCKVPWDQLPKTDTMIFPLLITDTVGNTIQRFPD